MSSTGQGSAFACCANQQTSTPEPRIETLDGSLNITVPANKTICFVVHGSKSICLNDIATFATVTEIVMV